MYNRVTSTSVSITNVGLVPYNSMVLTGPEVAIARFILVCFDAVICGICGKYQNYLWDCFSTLVFSWTLCVFR